MPYPDCNKTDALFFSVNCSFFQEACCQSEKMFLKSMQPCRKFLKSYSGWSLSVNSDAAAGNPLALVPAISQRHAAAIRPHRNFSAAPFSPGLGSSIFSQPEPEPPPASLPLSSFFHEPAARKPDSTAPVQRKIPIKRFHAAVLLRHAKRILSFYSIASALQTARHIRLPKSRPIIGFHLSNPAAHGLRRLPQNLCKQSAEIMRVFKTQFIRNFLDGKIRIVPDHHLRP